jgi:Leucine-rich repeat (LRR) protein
MKAIWITTIAALLVTAVLALIASAEDTPRRNKEFKGVDLYARFDKDQNQWLFGLLPGTNRLKDANEVNQSMTIKGLDVLFAKMKQLAPQEEVSLVPPDANGHDVTPLDEKTQKQLAEFCAKHEIILNGYGNVLEQPNRTIAAMEASTTRRELILSQAYTDAKGLAMIAEKFPALESLDLSYCKLSDGDFSSLGKLKSLTILNMSHNYGMSSKSFGFIPELKNLRRLTLDYCVELPDEAIAAIAKFSFIESLSLDSCKKLTAASAPHLAAMTGLKELNLHNVRLPDAAIRNLIKIKSLTSLDIALSLVSDETLAGIATLPNLKRLNLAVCPNVTFKGIKNLAPLRLNSLQLASLGSNAAPLDEKELFELAKETLPGCEISTFHHHFKP